MTTLAANISELLHENDCVIIPGFGGLVSHYQAATIHPTQHIFSPPSKAIAFNKNLYQNDGLLAQHICRVSGCDYKEALNVIAMQVQEMQFALEKGNSIRLEGVGMFMLDVEKNLQFFPSEETNYLADSFGLSEFQSPAIVREGIREKQQNPYFHPIRKQEPLHQGKRKSKLVRRALTFGSIALVVGVCSLPFLFPDSGVGMNQLSGFFSSKPSEAAKYESRKIQTDLSPLDRHSPEQKESNFRKLDFLKDGSRALVLDTRVIAAEAADSTRVASVAKLHTQELHHDSFRIIAGCFSLESNAQRFVDQLKSEFPDASIIGKNDSGWYRVSIGSAASRAEAEDLLKGSRQKLPQAWLLAGL